MIDHYEQPRNVGKLDGKKKNVGTGLVGAPACGDVMKLQVEMSLFSESMIFFSNAYLSNEYAFFD